MQWRSRCLIVIVFSVFYCEFLGDLFAILPCTWPSPATTGHPNVDVKANLNVMLIADTHLLGPIRGHWLDKLYREWHMRRAFQSALLLHKPDVIFVLGDLFDEGDMVDHDDFREFVRRFRSHFHAPADTLMISAVGNHDVGFHYKMHPYFMDRFEKQFNNTGVQMYTIRGNHFVFINSMALEDDGCEFCESAMIELNNVADKLNCMRSPKLCKVKQSTKSPAQYSRPIILQHFPTYMESSSSCLEHDLPTIEKYREKWDVLSKNATRWLGKLLQPRLAFGGHSHHYCHFRNQWSVDEYIVASFSWRNKVDPSFLMVSLYPSSHSVYKCNMLQQKTVYNVYTIAAIVCCVLIMWDLYLWSRRMYFKTKSFTKLH